VILGRVWVVETFNLNQETTTRTDDTMALRRLLEKSSDADLLREMIGFAAERLVALWTCHGFVPLLRSHIVQQRR
jgi:hypothetical protein